MSLCLLDRGGGVVRAPARVRSSSSKCSFVRMRSVDSRRNHKASHHTRGSVFKDRVVGGRVPFDLRHPEPPCLQMPPLSACNFGPGVTANVSSLTACATALRGQLEADEVRFEADEVRPAATAGAPRRPLRREARLKSGHHLP